MPTITEDTLMFDINGTLVSLDLVERFFCCDLDRCLGACCIEGDAGAPITEAEYRLLKQVLPKVWPYLLPAAQRVVADSGVAYVDDEGDLVTNIVDGRNCVFTCYEPGGRCSCAIEKAFRKGEIAWRKPASCFLYPVRVKRYEKFTAVNYHRWKICKAAEVMGRQQGIRLYQFLREPLIEQFGQAWYDELCEACRLYEQQYLSNDND